MKLLMNCLLVGGAGFVGAVARYVVGVLFTQLFGPTLFPIATLFINVTGSALLGWFITYMGTRYSGAHSHELSLAIGIGFVGAYTTFSTYMLESDKLFRQGASIPATVYIFGSIALGLIGVELGMRLAR